MRDLLRRGAEVDSSAAARELEQTLDTFHLVRASRDARPSVCSCGAAALGCDTLAGHGTCVQMELTAGMALQCGKKRS